MKWQCKNDCKTTQWRLGNYYEFYHCDNAHGDAPAGLGKQLASILACHGSNILVHGAAGQGRYRCRLGVGIVTRCTAGHCTWSARARISSNSLDNYRLLPAHQSLSTGATGIHCVHVHTGFPVFQYVGSRYYGHSLSALVNLVACAYQYVALALVVYHASRFQAQVSRILISIISRDAT